MIYILANILLAAVPANYGALIFLRIVQAFGSSAVVSMGAGTVADVSQFSSVAKMRLRNKTGDRAEKTCSRDVVFPFRTTMWPNPRPGHRRSFRGTNVLAMDIWISRYSWLQFFQLPSVFRCSDSFSALSGFALWLMIILALPETLRSRVGNGQMYINERWILLPPSIFSKLAPQHERGPPPPKPTLTGYWRLFRYPPIGIVSFNTAILYSTYFCIAVELPSALSGVYHWSTSEVGAGYLVIGIALVIGSICGGHFSDWRRAYAVNRAGEDNVPPEKRLVDQIWGVILCGSGTVMFGWFVDKSIHPAAVLISTFLSKSQPYLETFTLAFKANNGLSSSWLWHVLGLRCYQRLSDGMYCPTGCGGLCSGQYAP